MAYEYDDDDEIRLRVDRRQLEYILKAPRFCMGGVHVFEQIAQQCGIKSIGIDPNFKIGARSKKDPTVWVVGPRGNPRALNQAKEAVLQLFDTKANRVSLKVDIPHEHHFFVIGRKGENMKRVMSGTGCHIHFPDSNRSPRGGGGGGGAAFGQMKNQVSIAGTPDSVELARTQIRGLLPFTISFDVPDSVPAEDVRPTPSIRKISEEFRVTVFFKQRTGRGPLALVKGTRDRASTVEQAARRLRQEWTQDPLQVYTVQVDVSCPHHASLIGKGGEAIQALRTLTGATSIRFPHAHHDSSVFISGAPPATKLAFAYVQGCLPLVMMFEFSEDRTGAFLEGCKVAGMSVEDYAAKAATSFSVHVVAKHKGAVISFTLKSIEAKASQLHATRVRLLQMAGEKGDCGLGMMRLDDPALDRVIDDPEWQPVVPDQFFEASAAPNPPVAAPAPPPAPGLAAPTVAVTKAAGFSRTLSNNSAIGDEMKMGTIGSDGSISDASSSGGSASLRSAQHLQGLSADVASASDDDIILKPGAGQSSAQLSNSARSIRNAVARPPLVPNYEKKKLEAQRAVQNPDFSRVRHPTSYFAGGGFSRSMDESEWRKHQKPAYSHRMATISSPQPVSEEVMSPDPSRSTPYVRSKLNRQAATEQRSGGAPTAGHPPGLVRSGSTTPQAPSPVGDQAMVEYWNVRDLKDLLGKLKLDHYNAKFNEQEIDLATFLTLSDEDLREVGVTTFGAHRKMSAAIQQLNQMRAHDRNFLTDMYTYTAAPASPAAAPVASTPRRRDVRDVPLGKSMPQDFLSQSLTASFNRQWTRLGNSGSGGTLKGRGSPH
eukprot:m.158322 g.158322  ORF g.158322 m.158322 type:complete len:826 (+) comp17599_c0_seq1:560-3037(+)